MAKEPRPIPDRYREDHDDTWPHYLIGFVWGVIATSIMWSVFG